VTVERSLQFRDSLLILSELEQNRTERTVALGDLWRKHDRLLEVCLRSGEITLLHGSVSGMKGRVGFKKLSFVRR
jgi:hypothetical protein